MLEKPDLQDERIIDHIWDEYRLEIDQVEFLPIGDISSAKYRVVTKEPAAFFLKLRKGSFEETSVVVPHYLHEQGISQILPARETIDDRLWTDLDGYTCILYPYTVGQNGFENSLTGAQWRQLGAALHGIHSILLPPVLQKQIPFETYSPHWREKVQDLMEQVERTSYEDPVAAKMAAVLQIHRDEIRFIVERAGQLGIILQSHPPERVLCHSDIHAGNLLLDKNGALYVIDWDNPIMAPKERDLMFIGGGVGGIWNTPGEEALFYQGYGEVDINLTALAYYRYERIVEDIAEFSQQILLTTEGGADRERSLRKFKTTFLPGQVLEIAWKTDQFLNGG